MSKSNKTDNKQPAAETPSTPVPSFEEALADLQQIARDLEEGTLGLEESIGRFEQGIALLRSCYQILERAEQKIEIVTGLNADGVPITAPFDGTATISRTQRSAGRRKAADAAAPCDATSNGEPDTEEDARTLF